MLIGGNADEVLAAEFRFFAVRQKMSEHLATTCRRGTAEAACRKKTIDFPASDIPLSRMYHEELAAYLCSPAARLTGRYPLRKTDLIPHTFSGYRPPRRPPDSYASSVQIRSFCRCREY